MNRSSRSRNRAAARGGSPSALRRSPLPRVLCTLLTFFLVKAPLMAAALPPMLAAGAGITKLKSMMSGMTFFIMLIAFLLGIIVMVTGFFKMSQGEQALMQVVGGALIAGAPTIMYFVYDVGGIGGAAITSEEIIAAGSGQ